MNTLSLFTKIFLYLQFSADKYYLCRMAVFTNAVHFFNIVEYAVERHTKVNTHSITPTSHCLVIINKITQELHCTV